MEYNHQIARAEFATREDYPLEHTHEDNSKEQIFNSLSDDQDRGDLFYAEANQAQDPTAYQTRQDDMRIDDNEYAAEEFKEVLDP
jgi:hypothetical protein